MVVVGFVWDDKPVIIPTTRSAYSMHCHMADNCLKRHRSHTQIAPIKNAIVIFVIVSLRTAKEN